MPCCLISNEAFVGFLSILNHFLFYGYIILVYLHTVIQTGFVCSIIESLEFLLSRLIVVRPNLVELIESVVLIFSIVFLPLNEIFFS